MLVGGLFFVPFSGRLGCVVGVFDFGGNASLVGDFVALVSGPFADGLDLGGVALDTLVDAGWAADFGGVLDERLEDGFEEFVIPAGEVHFVLAAFPGELGLVVVAFGNVLPVVVVHVVDDCLLSHWG